VRSPGTRAAREAHLVAASGQGITCEEGGRHGPPRCVPSVTRASPLVRRSPSRARRVAGPSCRDARAQRAGAANHSGAGTVSHPRRQGRERGRLYACRDADAPRGAPHVPSRPAHDVLPRAVTALRQGHAHARTRPPRDIRSPIAADLSGRASVRHTGSIIRGARSVGVLLAAGVLACAPARAGRPVQDVGVPAGPAPASPPSASPELASRAPIARARAPHVLDASAWRGQPVTRIEELLMLGRVPGVQVTRTAGGYEVRVRGAAPLSGARTRSTWSTACRSCRARRRDQSRGRGADRGAEGRGRPRRLRHVRGERCHRITTRRPGSR
jgi:hypothetical protein